MPAAIATDSSTFLIEQVNKQGDFRSNAAPGPNAVTWGVFPSAEIIQPTVVDAEAFQAWKDEAFELGSMWAKFYEKTAPESAKMINDIFDTFYLSQSFPRLFALADEWCGAKG